MFRKSVKNTKFVVTTWVRLSSKCTKIRFRAGHRPGHRWGAYSDPPDSLTGGEGADCPVPETPPPLLALWASIFFGPSGLDFLATGLNNINFQANVTTLRSPYAIAVRLSSVVCNVVAPYPEGNNFRQYYCTV